MPSPLSPTRRAGALALALLALAAAACSDPAGPALPPDAPFALVREGTRALPVVMYQTEGYTATLLADTLRFGADGTGRQVTVLRVVDPEHPQGTISRGETAFTYRRIDDVAVVDFVCPANAACAAGPHLRVAREGDELVVTVAQPQVMNRNARRYRPAG